MQESLGNVTCPPHHWLIASLGSSEHFDERWSCAHCGLVKTVTREDRRQAMEARWTARSSGRRTLNPRTGQNSSAESSSPQRQ